MKLNLAPESDLTRPEMENIKLRLHRVETKEISTVTLGAIANGLLTTRGDIIMRNATVPERLALTVPSSPTINYLGVANGETQPTWKSASSAGAADAHIVATDASGYTSLVQLTAPTIYGSAAANGDLTLEGTSSATKTSSVIGMQTTGDGIVIVGSATDDYYASQKFIVTGTKDGEIAFLSVNKNTAGTSGSTVQNFVAGSTIAQFVVVNESYSNNTTGYGTVASTLHIINRGGPILFKVGEYRDSGEIARISAAGLELASGCVLKVNTAQVVGARGAAVADATDAASVILRLNDLLARLRTHGLIAT